MKDYLTRQPMARVTFRLSIMSLVFVAFALACAREGGEEMDLSWITYPAVERGSDADAYYGVEVPDPYRALEDEGSEATQGWVATQDDITERYFALLPERQEAVSYLKDHWLDGVVMVPVRKGDKAFFFKAVPGKPHNLLYMIQGEGTDPEVVFDLNENDPDGLRSTQASITVSPNGRYVGYPIQYAGADAAETHFYDTEAGRELDEFIPEARAGVTAWLPDESGFFYSYVDLPT